MLMYATHKKYNVHYYTIHTSKNKEAAVLRKFLSLELILFLRMFDESNSTTDDRIFIHVDTQFCPWVPSSKDTQGFLFIYDLSHCELYSSVVNIG